MAQTDTGFGWSADSAWLISLGAVRLGDLVSASATGYPSQPLPVLINDGDVQVGAMHIGSYWQYRDYNVYMACATPGVSVFVGSISNYDVRLYSTAETYDIKLCYKSELNPQGEIQTYSIRGSYSSELGLYAANRAIASRYVSWDTTTVFPGSDVANIIQQSSQSIYKLNSGYAVAAFVRWTELDTYWCPVLISSDPNAVVLSTDGVNPSANSTIVYVQNDGIKFYMSYIRGISGNPAAEVNTVDADSEYVGPPGPHGLSYNDVFYIVSSSEHANILVEQTVDPYEDFGNTEEDAGEVDPDPDDDDIEEDDLPTESFAAAGFCRIYKPSIYQLNDLADYLWTDQTFLQTVINHLKQIIENPIDAIISLSLVPCVPPTSEAAEVKVMYIPTGVYMPPVTNQFVEVDCGTFALKEMYGSALDYNPYTSVQLYLPYVGIVQLDTDEVMGKILHVGYRIDVVTGVCCAYVKANDDVLYQFSGHCSIQQPITSADFSGYVGAAIAAGKLVASIAAAGAGAPEVAASLVGAQTPSISGTSSETRVTERNEKTGRQITSGTRTKETVTENPGASFGEVATKGISNTVGSVMNAKTIVQHSGGFSGNSGYLAAVRRPYLIVTRPRIANPSNYGQFNGRPSMIYLNLGSCTGFTKVHSIQLTGIDATNPELSEIATLLTSGVIF